MKPTPVLTPGEVRALEERAAHRIQLLQDEIHEFYASFRVSNDLIELRNLVLTAELIVRSALERKESRGLHFSRDYPETLAEARDTILVPAIDGGSAFAASPPPEANPVRGAAPKSAARIVS